MKRWWWAIGLSLGVLLYRWGAPLASIHAFRETQTALTTYWLLHGSPWLNYQTPLFGAPWRAPFEFPLFQWVTACVAWTGIPLDFAGRLVSWAFMIATIWPLRGITRAWEIDSDAATVLYLCSPIYLYWGTCFLIETCAIFFGAMFLWLSLERRKSLSILLGCIGAMIKGTAFVPFAIASLAWYAAIPLCAGLLWQKWTDYLKPVNTLAGVLNSHQPAQTIHNYGSLADRLQIPWIAGQTLMETLGFAGFALIVLLIANGAPIKWRLVAAFLAPLIIFPRIVMVHEYYRMENAIFLILLVAAMWPRPSRGLLAAFIVGQAVFFWTFYAPILRAPQPMQQFAQMIREHTDPDDVILIYSHDWSSILPYYSQRRFIMENPLSSVGAVIARAREYHPVVVIRCSMPEWDSNPKYAAIFDKWKLPARTDGQCQAKWIAH